MQHRLLRSDKKGKDKKLLFTPRHDFFSLDAGALKHFTSGNPTIPMKACPSVVGSVRYW
jgi:hypothetical protein